MDQSIFKYTWRHTRKEQIWLLTVVLLSQPFYFLSLELPKRIINGPIEGSGFSGPTDTEPAMQIGLSLPEWLGGGGFEVFQGFEFDRVSMLIYLCSLFLGFVLINGLFKYYISTYKGRVGERMLRRLRYELVDRLLRFPIAQFRRVRSSEVATMVKDEVEPLGGFIGDAFVQPAFLLSQALTAMLFILLQSVSLGLVALAIVGVQVILIPRLRRRLLVLGRQRQITARQLAGRVGEVVEGINSIRVNDVSNWERAEVASRLGNIFFIRFDIYQWKFLVKFINNLLAQITPFIFYLVGGYLAITGKLDIGQLVAVIAAYKDLPAPLKDLIDWDQQRLDVQVKYTQVVEQFTLAGLLDPAIQRPETKSPPRFERDVVASNVAVRDDSGASLLEPTSARLVRGEAVAATGSGAAGGEYLAEAFARLLEPSAGRITFDGQPLETLPEYIAGRRIGYVEATTYFPQGTIWDSLVYGLRHAPLKTRERAGRSYRQRLYEARAAGNSEFHLDDDWIDYQAAGATGPEDLIDRVREALVTVDLEGDVYRLGLRSRLPDDLAAELGPRLLAARQAFHARLTESRAEQYVEGFDPDRYVLNASVIENIIFGLAVKEELGGEPLERHPHVRATLAEAGLDEALFEMGRQIAETLIELFGDLAPDNRLLERMDLMGADELAAYRAVLRRLEMAGAGEVAPADRQAVLKLAFGYIEPRHRLGLLDAATQAGILAARRGFRDTLPDSLAGVFHFHRPGELNPASSVQDNVLFGRVVDTYADAEERVRLLLRETMDALGLTGTVIRLGLAFDHGSGAKRLSGAQQQKLALARALVKRPDFLIVNRALSALDAGAQDAIIARVLDRARSQSDGSPTIFWVLNNPASAHRFDRVLAFESGRLVQAEVPPADAEQRSARVA